MSSFEDFMDEVDDLFAEIEAREEQEQAEVARENSFWDWYWKDYERELAANQVNLPREISMHSACRGPVVRPPFPQARNGSILGAEIGWGE